jgi:hypothetical protein
MIERLQQILIAAAGKFSLLKHIDEPLLLSYLSDYMDHSDNVGWDMCFRQREWIVPGRRFLYDPVNGLEVKFSLHDGEYTPSSETLEIVFFGSEPLKVRHIEPRKLIDSYRLTVFDPEVVGYRMKLYRAKHRWPWGAERSGGFIPYVPIYEKAWIGKLPDGSITIREEKEN